MYTQTQIIAIMMFQFHKVRLKVGRADGRCPVSPPFQFHKVRLKVPVERQRNHSRMFQFHKVRLKVYLSQFL